jgi:16S rRNA (guanine527-N7)-methyltransferase
VECIHSRVEDEKRVFDFVVSRAVMPLPDLVKVAGKNISLVQKNAIPNGIICLKGGDIINEIKPYRRIAELVSLATYFNEPFFETKKLVYLPINK